MISSARLSKAFFKGKLGTENTYRWWTVIWGLRSKIWRRKKYSKSAQSSLGEMTKRAIEEGNSTLFRSLADALDEMKDFERKPANALRADIYFSIEELNQSRPSFTRSDLHAWLNDQLDADVSKTVLDCELRRLNLKDHIPTKKKQK